MASASRKQRRGHCFQKAGRMQAIAHLKAAQKFEHDHPMYYADILPRPTGEMLGEMLLRAEKPGEALSAYQNSLEIAPNRFDSLRGAQEAAAKLHNAALVRDYAERLQAEGAYNFRPVHRKKKHGRSPQRMPVPMLRFRSN